MSVKSHHHNPAVFGAQTGWPTCSRGPTGSGRVWGDGQVGGADVDGDGPFQGGLGVGEWPGPPFEVLFLADGFMAVEQFTRERVTGSGGLGNGRVAAGQGAVSQSPFPLAFLVLVRLEAGADRLEEQHARGRRRDAGGDADVGDEGADSAGEGEGVELTVGQCGEGRGHGGGGLLLVAALAEPGGDNDAHGRLRSARRSCSAEDVEDGADLLGDLHADGGGGRVQLLLQRCEGLVRGGQRWGQAEGLHGGLGQADHAVSRAAGWVQAVDAQWEPGAQPCDPVGQFLARRGRDLVDVQGPAVGRVVQGHGRPAARGGRRWGGHWAPGGCRACCRSSGGTSPVGGSWARARRAVCGGRRLRTGHLGVGSGFLGLPSFGAFSGETLDGRGAGRRGAPLGAAFPAPLHLIAVAVPVDDVPGAVAADAADAAGQSNLRHRQLLCLSNERSSGRYRRSRCVVTVAAGRAAKSRSDHVAGATRPWRLP